MTTTADQWDQLSTGYHILFLLIPSIIYPALLTLSPWGVLEHARRDGKIPSSGKRMPKEFCIDMERTFRHLHTHQNNNSPIIRAVIYLHDSLCSIDVFFKARERPVFWIFVLLFLALRIQTTTTTASSVNIFFLSPSSSFGWDNSEGRAS